MQVPELLDVSKSTTYGSQLREKKNCVFCKSMDEVLIFFSIDKTIEKKPFKCLLIL